MEGFDTWDNFKVLKHMRGIPPDSVVENYHLGEKSNPHGNTSKNDTKSSVLKALSSLTSTSRSRRIASRRRASGWKGSDMRLKDSSRWRASSESGRPKRTSR